MPTGREGVSSLQDEAEDELGEDGALDTETEAPEGDEDYGESATESLERILGDKAEDLVSGDNGEEKAPEEAESPESPDLLERKQEKPEENLDDGLDPGLSPPDGLDAKGLRVWNNIPKTVRRQFNKANQRRAQEMQADYTRKTQEAAHAVGEWAPMREALRPYTSRWAEMGVSETAGMLQLAASQHKLTDPNPETREAEFAKLAQRARVDVVKLARRVLGQDSNQSGELNQHPAVAYANTQNSALQSEIGSLRSEMQQMIAAPLAADMEAARNEKDPTHGRLLRPALHDEAFLTSLKPRVAELVRTTPGVSYGEALKFAHDEKLQTLLGDSYRPIPSRLPASAKTNTTRAAATSIRGRPVPQMANGELDLPDDVKGDARSSLSWFIGSGSR